MNTDKSAAMEQFKAKPKAKPKKDNRIANARQDRRDARRKVIKIAHKLTRVEADLLEARQDKSRALREVQLLRSENSTQRERIDELQDALEETTEEAAGLYRVKHDLERERDSWNKDARKYMLSAAWWKKQSALMLFLCIGLVVAIVMMAQQIPASNG